MLLLLAASLPVLLTGPAPEGCVAVPAPRVNNRVNVARATTSPWVEANAARYLRKPEEKYCVEAPVKSAALAAAEAFAFGVSAWIRSADGEPEFGKMLQFIRDLPVVGDLPAVANIGVVDDGSAQSGELMNLLSRRNLLYRLVRAPEPKLDVNVTGSHAADPAAEAYAVRQKLGDPKRLVRLYGSEVVLAHLTGDSVHVRLHLLNYANRPVNGLRVRLLGRYANASVRVYSGDVAKLADFASDSEAVEFTIPAMNEYAVVDLSVGRR